MRSVLYRSNKEEGDHCGPSLHIYGMAAGRLINYIRATSTTKQLRHRGNIAYISKCTQ